MECYPFSFKTFKLFLIIIFQNYLCGFKKKKITYSCYNKNNTLSQIDLLYKRFRVLIYPCTKPSYLVFCGIFRTFRRLWIIGIKF